jgi:RNA polymerase sigma-70 factor (ECF subfamily)
MEKLILKAKNGDRNAFTTLILNIEDELYKIARTRLNNEDDILDVIQDTIISAYKSIKKLRKPELFKKWIIKILINKCNDQYRKKQFIELNENIVGEIEIDSSKIDFDCLMKILNYDERIAMTLFYLEGYTTKEIGKLLKTNENTIKTRIKRAKEKIKNRYKGGIKI